MEDGRDDRSWVVLELSYKGERVAAEGQLHGVLVEALPAETPIFIPYLSYTYEGKVNVFNVMEGYCFVASGLDERVYFNLVEASPYFNQVLHSHSGGNRFPVLLTVPETHVQDLQRKLADMVAVEITEGMRVEIRRGICRGLEGEVVALSAKNAQVLITLRTLRTIRTIPRYALLPKEKVV